MSPFFSIIVPIYNEGQRLIRAVKSAQKQTFTDIEILIIDDGSTNPETLDLLENVAKEERTRLIHKENGGVSSARNLGMQEAKGEYIIFLDGDDYLEPDTCACYRELIMTGAQKPELLITNYLMDDERLDTKQPICPISKDEVFADDRDQALRTTYAQGFFNNRGCYQSDLIRKSNVSFNEEWAVFEDIDFALRLVIAARVVAVTQLAKYHYCLFRKHPELSLKRFESQIRASEYWIRLLHKDSFEGETRNQLCRYLADLMAVYYLKMIDIPKGDRRRAFEICSETADYLKYGSAGSINLYRGLKCLGNRTLIPLGYLYRFTHRKVVC